MPTASAMNSSPKRLRARPRYIALTCGRWPGVPWSCRLDICGVGQGEVVGMRPPSKTRLSGRCPSGRACPSRRASSTRCAARRRASAGRRAGKRLAEVMRGVRRARGSSGGVPVESRSRRPSGARCQPEPPPTAQEVRVGEQLVLGALPTHAATSSACAVRQAHLHAVDGKPARELGDDLDEGRHVELEAAVAPRDAASDRSRPRGTPRRRRARSRCAPPSRPGGRPAWAIAAARATISSG